MASCFSSRSLFTIFTDQGLFFLREQKRDKKKKKNLLGPRQCLIDGLFRLLELFLQLEQLRHIWITSFGECLGQTIDIQASCNKLLRVFCALLLLCLALLEPGFLTLGGHTERNIGAICTAEANRRRIALSETKGVQHEIRCFHDLGLKLPNRVNRKPIHPFHVKLFTFKNLHTKM